MGVKLCGWGRYPVLCCRMARLYDAGALGGLLGGDGSAITRGNGRSYGDAALNPEMTISMLGMDRMQGFDPESGVLSCEAGVLLADILETFVPQGWFPPVVPGTKFVTVGGMIAADVHGKNHHRDGAFGAHVESLMLAGADGEIRRCSRSHNGELFRATLGGMGLTGVIVSARFRLKRIETAFVLAETRATRDLDETMAWFEGAAGRPFSVAWIDCLARGGRLGRALVTQGEFLERGALAGPLAREPLRRAAAGDLRLTVPIAAPGAVLNRVSIGAFNELYYRLGGMRGGARAVHFDRFFFPLDGIGAWNRLYGRAGFVQYQCVLPKGEGAAGIAALLERAADAGRGSFLAVLKLLGAAGEGPMSFPMEGWTLALDFPMREGTLELLDDFDAIVHESGGRVYLAKDARCGAERVRQGYPRLGDFQEARGGAGKFASALSGRLSL